MWPYLDDKETYKVFYLFCKKIFHYWNPIFILRKKQEGIPSYSDLLHVPIGKWVDLVGRLKKWTSKLRGEQYG